MRSFVTNTIPWAIAWAHSQRSFSWICNSLAVAGFTNCSGRIFGLRFSPGAYLLNKRIRRSPYTSAASAEMSNACGSSVRTKFTYANWAAGLGVAVTLCPKLISPRVITEMSSFGLSLSDAALWRSAEIFATSVACCAQAVSCQYRMVWVSRRKSRNYSSSAKAFAASRRAAVPAEVSFGLNLSSTASTVESRYECEMYLSRGTRDLKEAGK